MVSPPMISPSPNLLGSIPGLPSSGAGAGDSFASLLGGIPGLSGGGGDSAGFGLPGLGLPGGDLMSGLGSPGGLGLSSEITGLMSMLGAMTGGVGGMINEVLAGIADGSISDTAPVEEGAATPSGGATATAESGGSTASTSTATGNPGAANAEGFISPLAGGSYSVGDGLGAGRNHGGQDLAAPEGTAIMAAKEGRIVEVANDPDGYGQYITIEHEGGVRTRYAHMSKYGEFKEGDTVQAGDVIGEVGSTGRSTGPHLHFEVISPDGGKLEPREHVELG